MTEDAPVDAIFDSLGEEFCWHARQYAFLLGSECVDTEHLLFAALEVSPVELHGAPELTPDRLLRVLPPCESGTSVSDWRPRRLSPSASDVVVQVADAVVTSGCPPSLRDVWIALLANEKGYVWFLVRQLGVNPLELRQRLLEK